MGKEGSNTAGKSLSEKRASLMAALRILLELLLDYNNTVGKSVWGIEQVLSVDCCFIMGKRWGNEEKGGGNDEEEEEYEVELEGMIMLAYGAVDRIHSGTIAAKKNKDNIPN